jgi:tight adherence protein C
VSGAVLGLAVLAGLASLVAGVPRRPRLAHRLGPYLPDPAGGPAPAGWSTGPARWDSVGDPWCARAVRIADRMLGGGGSVRRRLAVLPDGRTLRDFRAEQLAYGAFGLVAGAVVGAALTVATGRSAVAGPLLAGAGGVAGVLARDVALTRRVRRRQAAVLAEFPVVAELLALAVTAGEGPVGALDRVCRLTGGALTADLGAVLARVRAGAPLAAALEELRDRAGVPVLARFVDGMLVALERGTPLADVLRAQAADVREAGRRALLETGGRREIAMLAPVVFAILPTTVLFALYPGLVAVAGLAGG